MLCFLRATEIAPAADVLLMSAMMGNEDAIADWVRELLGRPCLPLRVDWKPTRQARGCVVFDQAEVTQLRRRLTQAKQAAKKQGNDAPNPPAAVKRSVSARPHALFCMKQRWSTQETSDYTLLPLLDAPVALGVNKYWGLTANRNHIAAVLGSQFGTRGMKTLVFAQNKQHAMSLAREVAERFPGSIELNEDEKNWRAIAIEELGGEEHLLGLTDGKCGFHHGLLLSAERHMVESLFQRDDGLPVLAGTPTLAQG
jgi:Lhr-like helicase